MIYSSLGWIRKGKKNFIMYLTHQSKQFQQPFNKLWLLLPGSTWSKFSFKSSFWWISCCCTAPFCCAVVVNIYLWNFIRTITCFENYLSLKIRTRQKITKCLALPVQNVLLTRPLFSVREMPTEIGTFRPAFSSTKSWWASEKWDWNSPCFPIPISLNPPCCTMYMVKHHG